MKQLRFVCAQPAIAYYTWQVDVMINNFIDMGINPNLIDIVCWKENGVISEAWSKLANHYNYVRFFFYDDLRETRHYISSIRPNILKQHWQARPELKDNHIFYHDCDIVFTKKINWDQFLNDDKWYGSDTRWYISHDYIISKGQDILDRMCEIVKIDKELVKKNELNSIGAQYIMKDIDWKYWDQVEKDCEILFKDITAMNDIKVKENPTYHTLQIWCADMWAVLWNAWKMGKETVCHDDLQFAWATSNEADWNKHGIFHNAGVTDDKGGLFYKANYMNKLPYNEDLKITEHTASWYYWNNVQKVGKKSILL